MLSFLIPMSLARMSLAMSASYSASLFVAQKPHRMACWIRFPSGEVRTKPMTDPLTLLEPLTESVHLELERSVRLSSSLSACGVKFGVKSAMKLANTYNLSVVCGCKVMSYSLNSTVHLVSRPKSSGLCNMLFSG